MSIRSKIAASYFFRTRPFFVAELSANHNQSLDRSLAIVDAAAAAGAHAVKLQTYTADTMTRPQLLTIKHGLWKGEDLYTLYSKAAFPREWHKPIFDRCKQKNLVCFSTPFSREDVDFLEELNCPIYKIASFEITDLDLIAYAASKQKPIIISTGMATGDEIRQAQRACEQVGNMDYTFLKCTSAYPADHKESNLVALKFFERYCKRWGLSDHTLGIGCAVAAVALGASVIEKHLTLNRQDGGVDDSFSMEPQEFKLMVDECKRAQEAMGKFQLGPTEGERKNLVFRRSIYAIKDIKPGEVFTHENTRTLRPAGGLPADKFPFIINKVARRAVKANKALSWEDVEV